LSDPFRRIDAFGLENGNQSAVMVGDQVASSVYVQQILRSCNSVGIPGRVVDLPRSATADELRRTLERLNDDPEVAGIIVQLAYLAVFISAAITCNPVPTARASNPSRSSPANSPSTTLTCSGTLARLVSISSFW